MRILMLMMVWLLPLSVSAQESLSGPVEDVLDGGRFRLQGRVVRLRDMEPWARDQSCPDMKGQPFGCGEDSVRYLKNLIEGKLVACRIRSRDKRGDLVALCRVGSLDVGGQMVRSGHALPAWSRGRYRQEKNQARRSRVGGWRGLPDYFPQRPSQWRRKQRKQK